MYKIYLQFIKIIPFFYRPNNNIYTRSCLRWRSFYFEKSVIQDIVFTYYLHAEEKLFGQLTTSRPYGEKDNTYYTTIIVHSTIQNTIFYIIVLVHLGN